MLNMTIFNLLTTLKKSKIVTFSSLQHIPYNGVGKIYFYWRYGFSRKEYVRLFYCSRDLFIKDNVIVDKEN